MSPAGSGRFGGQSPESWTALRWDGGVVYALDQRRLPGEEVYLALDSAEDVARAIESLALRGAPLIGCAAALGIALAARRCPAERAGALARALDPHFERLAATRPTAVNLSWALRRMRGALDRAVAHPGRAAGEVRAALLAEALDILEQDVTTCRAIGAAGLPLVPDGARILTHCNAGALATAGYGTALGVVRAACAAGRKLSVLACETRPFLQGARLTAWELARDGVPVEVITDSAAGFLMQRGEIDLVLVGADRIARNGDVANKIGTYALAVLAREHRIPMLVAAPISSVDLSAQDGDAIPIEERSREEVACIAGRSVVPEGVPVRHPAFDITPARLVSALVTERGILRPPFEVALARVVEETVSRITTN